MPKNNISTKARQDYVRALAAKFPRHGARSLGRLAWNEEPSLFTSENAARHAFRWVRGRKKDTDGYSAKSPLKADVLPPIPPSLYEPWDPFQGVSGRVLVLSDIHEPYHDKPALEAALAYGDKYRPDVVFLNGDTLDFFAASRFLTDPRQRKLANELETGRALLAHLRGRYPEARLIFKLGNHEERWEHYLWIKAPELCGVDDFELRNILRFGNYGVEEVRDQRPVMFGKLAGLHGHEFPKGGSNPVSPSRSAFLRAMECCFVAHHHRSSAHDGMSLLDRLIATWSTGCLCGLHPEYARINQWNHGFATIEVQSDGDFDFDNKRIRHGRVL